MVKLKRQSGSTARFVWWACIILLALGTLLIYKLGSLVHGLSLSEVNVSKSVLGWHGIYHSIFYVPLTLAQSIIFSIIPNHGQTLTRLPSAFFGLLTMLSFGWLIWLWHGKRTALIASPLFITSAWVLHVSRYASNDIMYLWAITTLLLTHTLLQKYTKNIYAWLSTAFLWGLLLTIPGMQWFLIAEIVLQQKNIKTALREHSSIAKRAGAVVLFILWIPLLIITLTHSGTLMTWLGMPSHFPTPFTYIKNFFGVFAHLFIRGPLYPTLWLGRVPLLDAFTLTMSALGIYFYASRWDSSRSRLLGILFIIGVLFVALNGPIVLSVLVPMMYCTAAMGIAYVLHEWLRVFPRNPLARGLGIGLVCFVVGVSCIYNLRSYFVAWPHNTTTTAVFRYHR